MTTWSIHTFVYIQLLDIEYICSSSLRISSDTRTWNLWKINCWLNKWSQLNGQLNCESISCCILWSMVCLSVCLSACLTVYCFMVHIFCGSVRLVVSWGEFISFYWLSKHFKIHSACCVRQSPSPVPRRAAFCLQFVGFFVINLN